MKDALGVSRRGQADPAFFSGGTGSAVLCALLSCLMGCAPQVSIQGAVYNLQDEPLPGVSVRAEGSEAFGVSNGNGLFGKRPNRLSVSPGTWELVYFKTGFTSARQWVDTGTKRLLDVPPVHLWPLPSGKGVYVLNGLTYHLFTRATPERYMRLNNGPVFGFKLEPELITDAQPDLIISHKMPNYDLQLSRLEEVTVLRQGVEPPPPDSDQELIDSLTEKIWAAVVRLPLQSSPIDEPDQQLWRITPSVVLGPGTYAVHWGALDGEPSTEPLVYLIRIRDPNAPAEEEAATEEAATEEAAAENQQDNVDDDARE